MNNILAIDPGGGMTAASKNPGPACAYFASRELVHVGFDYWPTGAGLDAVVVEDLHFRGAVDVPKMPGLLAMFRAGMLAAGHAAGHGGAPVVLLKPKDWKGEEPKPIIHARLLAVLAPAEFVLLGGQSVAHAVDMAVEAGALNRWSKPGVAYYGSAFRAHNLLDAAALGCVYLGRLEKR
jgi:hypothetical protein